MTLRQERRGFHNTTRHSESHLRILVTSSGSVLPDQAALITEVTVKAAVAGLGWEFIADVELGTAMFDLTFKAETGTEKVMSSSEMHKQ